MAQKKNKEEYSDEVLKSKADRNWEAASAQRKEMDWKWFTYDLWVLGNHYAKWDRNTQSIVSIGKSDGRVKVSINKVYTTLRSVRNYVLRNKPKAEVTPFNMTDENVNKALISNQYLDYLHDKLHLRRKLKASVWHALKYSVGFWQVLWNDTDEDGQGEIEINEIDPYDLYWDPAANHPDEAKYCILAVRRYVEDLRNDPKYDKYKKNLDNIKGDNQTSASTVKSRLLQHEKGGQSTPEDKDNGTVIVKECMYKERQEDGTNRIRIVTVAGEQLIRNELTELSRFPYFRLPCDIEPLSMYGQGWVKNLIPANKLLNRGESSVAEYNDIMNKGKYVTDRGAGIRSVNNQHGQIIEKKRGFELTPLQIPPMNTAQPMQIDRANTYIEDIGGAHDASLGRIPTGAHSGKALEALQTGDSNNMSEIIENVEEFLEEVFEYVLQLAAEKYQTTRSILTTNGAQQKEFMEIIGEGAANKPEGVGQISAKNVVDVKITSWLAHTTEARREAISQLAQILNAQQVPLDPQTILEAFEIGSIADVVKRMKEHQAQQMDTQSQVQQDQTANQLAGQQAQQQMNAPPQAGAQEAIAALRMLLSGKTPKPPVNPAPDFIQYIDQFLQSPEAQTLAPETLQQIQIFRDQVVQAPTQQKPQAKPAMGR